MPDDLLNGQNSQNEPKGSDSGADLGDQSEQSPLEEAMTKMPEENPVGQAVPQSPPAEPVNPAVPDAEASPAQTSPEPSVPVEPVSPEPTSTENTPPAPVSSPEPTPAPEVSPSPEPAEAPIPDTPDTPDAPDTSSAEPVTPPTSDFSSSPSAPTQTEPDMSSGEQETAKAPDTDEFLKSILNDQPQNTAPATPAQTAPAPNLNSDQPTPEPSNFDSSPASTSEPEGSVPETPSAPVVPEEPPVNYNADSSQPGGTVPAPSMQDMGNIDGISSANASMPDTDSSQSELSPDSIQAPKPSGSPARLIILIIVAAILVIGGYLAYTLLFASNSTTTTVQKSATVAPNSSSDQVRKADLIKIQQALLNYFAGTGKYPVATTMIYLNTANNVVEKALVPAYLSALPADPDSPEKNYAYKSDGKTFTLSAVLDNATDPEGVAEGSITLYKVTEATKATASSTVTATAGASATKTTNSEASVSATAGI